MPTLFSTGIVKTTWSGTTGGAGVTTLAISTPVGDPLTSTQAQAAVNAVRAFWDGIKAIMPNEVQLTVQPTVDDITVSDGKLQGSLVVGTAPASVSGTDTGSYSMAAGLRATLNTGSIHNGRRVRGAIFIVPAAAASGYNNTGTALDTAKTTINTQGSTLLSALTTAGLELLVWSRPTPKVSLNDGTIHVVNSITCNNKTAILRGRRD